jgi:hypothetical protein
MPHIEHPACQGEDVSVIRWLKWHLSEWLGGHARRLEHEALYPNCEMCGKPRNRGDHSHCDELPF